MTDEPAIACSLNGPELPKRLEEMAALGDTALLDAQTEPRRAELRFAAGAGVRERVERIVAAEAECCAFLNMDVGEEPDVVVLAIEAPAGAELVLEELVAAFRSEPGQAG